MFELKPLPAADLEGALELAVRARASDEPEAAESACLDVLEVDPANARALELLILARTDMLSHGLPGGVERARAVLARLPSDYARAYYGGLISERQARHLLRQRGKRTGFVAYDMLRMAMEDYEAAITEAPEKAEPVVRYNACVRLIERHPHCVPDAEDRAEYGIE